MKSNITILFMLVSIAAFAQHDHAGHSHHDDQKNTPYFSDGKVGAVYTHYIQLKDALVTSNASAARKAAAELEIRLKAIPDRKREAQTAGQIAKATTIEEQRMLFVVLSDEVTALIKASKLSSGVIYLEYCPMANNNEGAFWLSNEKEIKNPYFGEKMLRCGSVKETVQ